MKNVYLTAVLFILLAGLTTCSRTPKNPEPTATADPAAAMQAALLATSEAQPGGYEQFKATWQAELETAEATWAAHPIDDYQITLTYSDDLRQAFQIHTLTVVDGEIVNESTECGSGEKNCIFARVAPENMTVPGLFAIVHEALELEELDEANVGVRFDEEVGYPQFIKLKGAGGGSYWLVDEFISHEP